MGLTDKDMLVMSLSSINPGKGQFLLLESVRLMNEQGQLHDSGIGDLSEGGSDYYSRALLQNWKRIVGSSNNSISNGTSMDFGKTTRKYKKFPFLFTKRGIPNTVTFDRIASMKKLSSESIERQEQKLKVLIGSVGSKSNKVVYVKALLRHLSLHLNLSKSVLWTPATTRVASLYAAADVYVMNSQGLGETFGRVTIEAMAFGLPVLGTDSGGTKEIVEHNVSGLLHPLGRPGARVLAKHLRFLVENVSVRQAMGTKGREKVEKMYLKKHMYQKFGEVLYKSMRIK